jgi:hypothetical protein
MCVGRTKLYQLYFSNDIQSQSNFCLLGDDQVDYHSSFVLAFARKPDEGALTLENSGAGRRKYLQVQGMGVALPPWSGPNSRCI